jgi:inner membrane transporter RhtA
MELPRPAPTTPLALAVAALVASMASLCVGSSQAKALFPLLGPEGMAASRIGLAACVLMALWRPWRRWPSVPEANALAAYGLSLGAMNLCFYLAIARIPLGLAVAVEFSGPLALALASSRRAQDGAWLALAALGLGLLLPWSGPGAEALDPRGVAWALGAAASWAAYIVAGQRLGGLPAGQATAWGLGIGAALVLPFGVGSLGPLVARPELWLPVMGVALLSSALPYSLEMLALRRLSKPSFGTLLSLEPAIGALAAWAVLGERLGPQAWLAIACVSIASAGSVWGQKPGAG